METNRTCPSCRKPLPADLPLGLCPECLIKSGFQTGTEPGSAGFVPPPVEEIAKLFPQLEILELLGRGGMGAVYKARQPRLNRLVALKILSPEKQGDPHFAERFAREAQALARLNHPSIVAVHDFGEVGQASRLSPSEENGMKSETGGTPVLRCYLIMEFVDGLSLRQLLQAGKMKPEQALAIVPQICEALQFAHEHGIVHRDIKPENILLDKQGRVKIADFGIAKMLGRDGERTNLTAEKQIIGTPHYMAPEQVEQPQLVDHRADIYSLGVVFYEMLTGELPLGKFQPPSHKVQVDVRLDEVVLHALAKEPERRYQHASEVKTDVETIAADSVATSRAACSAASARQPAEDTPSERRRKALLWYGFWASLIGLPVGLDLRLPFVWGLSSAGLVICAVKLGLFSKLLAGRIPPGGNAPGEALSALEFWITMDRGDYAQCWKTAAPLFQRTIGREEWVSQMEKMRRPLGQARSRKLRSLQLSPDRSCLAAVYDTSFDTLATAVESVSFAVQPGGEYKVISYHLKPAGGGEGEETQPGKSGVPLRAIIPNIAKRLLLTGLTAAVAQEAFTRLTLHWQESEQEIWLLPFLALSVVAALWAAWPIFRRSRSWRDSVFPWLGTSALLWFSLGAFCIFYMAYLSPNLGLYCEPSWMADNAGWQRQYRIGQAKHLLKRKLVAPDFGATSEMVLSLDNDQQVGFADLDTGRRTIRDGSEASETIEWARGEKFDAIAWTKAGQLSVEGLDLAKVSVSDFQWAEDSPQNVADYFLLEWQKPKASAALWPLADHWSFEQHLTRSAMPAWMITNNASTFYFRTREGRMGLLQIAGVAGDPMTVSLRAKLVRQPGAVESDP